ncbi:MAG TPA: hypothetical protein VFS00_24580 [Polyangiaceae bacterium]|nr:hypothetical protein [Polyangiaceae bacterium]
MRAPARATRARRGWVLLLAPLALSCGDRRTTNPGGAGAGGAAGAGGVAAMVVAGASGASGASGGADAGAEVALPLLNMTMRLPKGAEVLVGGRGGGVRIMLEPRARAPRLVEISPDGADSVPKGASSTRSLRGGGNLRYAAGETNGGSGSGGTAVELVGELGWNGHSYLIICRAQGEPPPPADWCLPYLDALRLTD